MRSRLQSRLLSFNQSTYHHTFDSEGRIIAYDGHQLVLKTLESAGSYLPWVEMVDAIASGRLCRVSLTVRKCSESCTQCIFDTADTLYYTSLSWPYTNRMKFEPLAISGLAFVMFVVATLAEVVGYVEGGP